MTNLSANIIGLIAGVLTAASMLPQLVKVIREKDADNISAGMLAILMAGLVFWVVYGVLKNDIPIIVTNSFSFLVNVALTFFRIKYKRKE